MKGVSAPAGQGPTESADLGGLVSYWLSSGHLLLLAVSLVEGMWFYAWMVWLGLWGGFGFGRVSLGPVSILFLLWTSFHTVQILGQQHWSTRKARLFAGFFSALLLAVVARLENGGGYGLLDPGWIRLATYGLAGTFPSALHVTLLGSAYLWWRGYRLAQEGLHQEQVLHSFLVGLGGLILALLAWEMAFRSGVGFATTRWHALAIVVVFFAAAASALAMSHLMRVRAEITELGEAPQISGQRWSAVLLGVVTGTVMAGAILSGVFSVNFWSVLVRLISLVSYAVAYLLYYLMLPIAYFVALLIYAVRWLIAKRGPVEQIRIQIPDLSALRTVTKENVDVATPLWVILLKWGLLLLILALAVRFLARLLLKRRRGAIQQAGFTELHESVGSWRDFVRDLLLGLFRLLFWFRGQGQRARFRGPARAHSRRDSPDQELEVREMYAALLDEARTAGFPRRAKETPNEYLDTLKRHFPTEGDALEQITHDYVSVRYGEQAVSPEEKGLLNRMWRRIYAGIRELIHVKNDSPLVK
ncbi:MAG: DUF4129 domain-containing protein [Dehalococcoidia bacterium]|nr:DUF4129 domain-containing protein [Dehalococcoidia bacterium]